MKTLLLSDLEIDLLRGSIRQGLLFAKKEKYDDILLKQLDNLYEKVSNLVTNKTLGEA